MLIESWDTDRISDQESIFGRNKDVRGAADRQAPSSTPSNLDAKERERAAGHRARLPHPAGRTGHQRRAEDPAPRLLLHRRHRSRDRLRSTPACSSSPTSRTRASSSSRSRRAWAPWTGSTSTSSTPAAASSPCRPGCRRRGLVRQVPVQLTGGRCFAALQDLPMRHWFCPVEKWASASGGHDQTHLPASGVNERCRGYGTDMTMPPEPEPTPNPGPPTDPIVPAPAPPAPSAIAASGDQEQWDR